MEGLDDQLSVEAEIDDDPAGHQRTHLAQIFLLQQHQEGMVIGLVRSPARCTLLLKFTSDAILLGEGQGLPSICLQHFLHDEQALVDALVHQ